MAIVTTRQLQNDNYLGNVIIVISILNGSYKIIETLQHQLSDNDFGKNAICFLWTLMKISFR